MPSAFLMSGKCGTAAETLPVARSFGPRKESTAEELRSAAFAPSLDKVAGAEYEIATGRLAQAFGLDAGALRREYERMLPVVWRQKSLRGCSNFEAWKRALLPQEAANGTLKAVLQRYGAFGISSAGIERNLALLCWTGRNCEVPGCASPHVAVGWRRGRERGSERERGLERERE